MLIKSLVVFTAVVVLLAAVAQAKNPNHTGRPDVATQADKQHHEQEMSSTHVIEPNDQKKTVPPKSSEAPHSDKPKVTKTTVTRAPKSTGAPNKTEAPKKTEGPKKTEAPKKTEVPKKTDAPKKTEAPKPVKTQEPVKNNKH